MKLHRVNFGCGMTPTKGWLNFDNSFSIKLASYISIVNLMFKFGVISQKNYEYIKFCRLNDIYWADVRKGIPLPDNSVDVVYTSHMIEHLDNREVDLFLKEVRRLLIKGGVLRIVVPDFRKLVQSYLKNQDADKFMVASGMAVSNPSSLFGRLKLCFFGLRHHLWMYDSRSLSKLLETHDFDRVLVMRPGQTSIKDPGSLDLSERFGQSLYIEAIKS